MSVSTNSMYAIYAPIHMIALLCVVPVLAMVVFGCLTYRNMRQIKTLTGQNDDCQLTQMVLIQVIVIVICFIPRDNHYPYSLITSASVKNADRQLKE